LETRKKITPLTIELKRDYGQLKKMKENYVHKHWRDKKWSNYIYADYVIIYVQDARDSERLESN
jgi:hypothetical protein